MEGDAMKTAQQYIETLRLGKYSEEAAIVAGIVDDANAEINAIKAKLKRFEQFLDQSKKECETGVLMSIDESLFGRVYYGQIAAKFKKIMDSQEVTR